MSKAAKHIASAMIISIFIVIAFGSQDEITSGAEGKVSNFEVISDFGVIDGEPEAGYTVQFTIKNVGEKGAITIKPKLSCSEGEWSRKQTITLNAGASRNLSYFFHEPTINATNVQGSVRVFP